MSDETPEPTEPTEIKESDIVFDCPHCGKSLAIDYHGAGLFITCPDCKNRVQVPIPEGMEVSDIDRSEEELSLQIIHLRELLTEGQVRIKGLETELGDLRQRREQLERSRTENSRVHEEIQHEVHAIERSLTRIVELSRRSSEPAKETT